MTVAKTPLQFDIDITNGPTPEMVEAGVDELREKHIGMDLAEIVTDVFYAMISAAPAVTEKTVPPSQQGS